MLMRSVSPAVSSRTLSDSIIDPQGRSSNGKESPVLLQFREGPGEYLNKACRLGAFSSSLFFSHTKHPDHRLLSFPSFLSAPHLPSPPNLLILQSLSSETGLPVGVSSTFLTVLWMDV